MKLALFGDYVPNPQISYQLDSAKNYQADVSLVNLEAPLFIGEEKRAKAGPHLSTSLDVLGGFERDVVISLANNHIMDYGFEGLEKTCNQIKKEGKSYIGAGKTIGEAERPIYIEDKNIRVAFLARCETQFGIASSTRGGVAPLSSGIFEQIRGIKKEADVVVLSIHGAAELSPWPSPKWQDLCRAYIDAGVDVVHGHHSHLPQGYERHNHGVIFYGLGNYIVDPGKWRDIPNALWSIAPTLNLLSNEISLDMDVAIIQELSDGVRIKQESISNQVQCNEYINMCNAPLADRPQLDSLWQEVSIRLFMGEFACSLQMPEGQEKVTMLDLKSRIKRFYSSGRTLISGKKYNDTKSTRNQLLNWYHLFACESHVDVISTALGVLSGELDDLRTEFSAELADRYMGI